MGRFIMVRRSIFLTGGTGFVGKYFIDEALHRGYRIYALVRKGSVSKCYKKDGLTWVIGSYHTDFSAQLKMCSILVHLAAHSTNPPYDSLDTCIKYNVIEPMVLFNNALAQGIKKYLVVGTGFEYGLSGVEYEKIPTRAPLLPTNAYSISKAVSSVLLSGWSIQNMVKLKYLRLFQVYGQGEAIQRLWPSLHAAAREGIDFDLTPGEQIRDFISVLDVAKKLAQELTAWDYPCGRPVFKNVGSGHPQSIREFASYWWNKWGAQGKLNFGVLPYRDSEVMRFVPLIEK